MQEAIENGMYALSQLFLIPTLIAILVIFVYALHALGRFAWQARQRRRGQPEAFELTHAAQRHPDWHVQDAEMMAARQLERLRLASRTGPMLGLVATMIPMGPALRSLADNKLSDMAHGLTVAFSAVILALLSAAIAHGIAQVRRRWYAQELLCLERRDPTALANGRLSAAHAVATPRPAAMNGTTAMTSALPSAGHP